jgi:hypothetical protein
VLGYEENRMWNGAHAFSSCKVSDIVSVKTNVAYSVCWSQQHNLNFYEVSICIFISFFAIIVFDFVYNKVRTDESFRSCCYYLNLGAILIEYLYVPYFSKPFFFMSVPLSASGLCS